MLDGGRFSKEPDEDERHEARAGDVNYICVADEAGQLREIGTANDSIRQSGIVHAVRGRAGHQRYFDRLTAGGICRGAFGKAAGEKRDRRLHAADDGKKVFGVD